MSVIAATGWRWHEVDDLTLPQLGAMNRYWEDHPPLHLMVAAYMGIGTKKEKPQDGTELVNMMMSVNKQTV